MVSTISWLDSSIAEQRRLREIIGLFSERDTQDDLGLGQMRDALGDGLFPGTSTLHTRAKYLLFIPWIFQSASSRGGSLEHARQQEINLIFALKKSDKADWGIIGSVAGRTLKNMPSTQYWSALGTYGILLNDKVSREEAVSLHGFTVGDKAEEGASDKFRVWRASLPTAPTKFPKEVEVGFDLNFDEATWLQERIVDSTRGSLLAHLAVTPPRPDSRFPWEDPIALQVEGEARELLTHARRFSDTMYGAQLLYNVLVAESYEAEGFTQREGRVEYFREELRDWASRFAVWDREPAWHLDDFFMRLLKIRNGNHVSRRSQQFATQWAELVATSDLEHIADNSIGRRLVQRQERGNKGAMARIGNPKRLATWGGSSGAGQFGYRWSYVQGILGDVHDGLASAEAES